MNTLLVIATVCLIALATLSCGILPERLPDTSAPQVSDPESFRAACEKKEAAIDEWKFRKMREYAKENQEDSGPTLILAEASPDLVKLLKQAETLKLDLAQNCRKKAGSAQLTPGVPVEVGLVG